MIYVTAMFLLAIAIASGYLAYSASRSSFDGFTKLLLFMMFTAVSSLSTILAFSLFITGDSHAHH